MNFKCLLIATLLVLGFANGAMSQETASETYKSVHREAPDWLKKRFEATIKIVEAGGKSPKATSKDVRNFLYETYEHINEVNELVRKLGSKARPIPNEAPSGELKGIHDFGERTSLRRLEEFVEAARKSPLKDFSGKPVPVPNWLENLVKDARAKGARSVDVGKLAPWIAAGLGRNGPPDIYSIRLHNLSAHHSEFNPRSKISGALIESIADRVNAMRQVRIYRKEPMSFETIRKFLMEDVERGKLPKKATKVIESAMKAQFKLERSGRVNPYFMKEAGHFFPRRSDGSINWKKFSKSQARQQGAGLAHFTLALFLKELAVVIRTGDKARIEEFFDGLASTDFFTHYGLFALGAQGSSVLYARTLEKFIKPRFVNTVLKTNVVLAAGMALPEILHGRFDGKTFVVDVVSLGLSSAAVKAGLAGMNKAFKIERLLQSGTMTAAVAKLRPYAKAGAWIYTAVETALVLYFGEAISKAIDKKLAERKARKAIGEATKQLFKELHSDISDEDFEKGLRAFENEHVQFRNGLYRELAEHDQLYQRRLQKAARQAKKLDDKIATLQKNLANFPRLRERLVEKHGSLDAAIESVRKEEQKDIQGDLDHALEVYSKARDEALHNIYNRERRDNDYLTSSAVSWAARGARSGQKGDPYSGRRDFYARRSRARGGYILEDAAEDISQNRFQAYEDLIRALQLAHDSTDNPKRKESLQSAITRTRQTLEADKELVSVSSKGAAAAVGDSIHKK